jgi:predicted amidohydrolase YtcJ
VPTWWIASTSKEGSSCRRSVAVTRTPSTADWKRPAAAADYFLARGVTWVQDAWVESADVATYLEAARRGALRMRFNLALYADPRHFDSQMGHFADARGRVDTALAAYSSGVACQDFAEGDWGSITPGAHADLVWLDGDPRRTPDLAIPHLSVRAAYLAGRQVYASARDSSGGNRSATTG